MKHSQKISRLVLLVCLILLWQTFIAPQTTLASVDSYEEDLVVDAPWRTIRAYLPVLFFAPDFEESSDQKITNAILSNYDPVSQDVELIFNDARNLTGDRFVEDRFPCAVSFIDPDGRPRGAMAEGEQIDSFWHYIARVPVACIGLGSQRGRPGVHYLVGRLAWIKNGRNQNEYKMLRVVVAGDGFAKFSPVDHQYDVHVHTIAEQTKWHGISNVDASRKAFGGPVAMLMESAYALGMVDVQLDSANWDDYENQIVTTDHNVFFSGPPFDAGTHPGSVGPTSRTNGKTGEFQWYRDHLGPLGGEEITIKGVNGFPLEALDLGLDTRGHFGLAPGVVKLGNDNILALGSHLLSYGAPHVEGPWHGGKVVLDSVLTGIDSPVSIDLAISHMGSSNGFGYASHPESGDLGWSREYYERAIGLGDFTPSGTDGNLIQRNGEEFVFKGLQVWNEHNDLRSRDSGDIEVSESHRFNPFAASDTGQRFISRHPDSDWRRGHDRTYAAYRGLLKRGLRFAFSDRREHVLIRKLYMSAGTDAHGDFNYAMSIPSTAATEVAESFNFDLNALSANSNAFGRLRTYTLTSQRYVRAGAEIPPNCPGFPFCGGAHPAPSYFPLEDYKEGNTVVTDGPVGRFSADGNCRFNSDIHRLAWHDRRCLWENHDGLIGGRGTFDGGNTLLAPEGNDGVYVNAQWIGKNDYLADSQRQSGPMALRFVKVNPNISSIPDDEGITFDGGPARSLNIRALQDVFSDPATIAFPGKSALILEGKLGREPDETKFLTNPVWIAPYKLSISAPDNCPIRPGELEITVEFALSMDTHLAEEADRPEVFVHMVMQRAGEVASGSARAGSGSAGSRQRPAQGNQDQAPEAEVAVEEPDSYTGLRVQIKPLSSNGDSGAESFRVTNRNARWQPVEITREFRSRFIQDAKFTTSNTGTIPCGGGWNGESHRPDAQSASYAVVVDQIYDMYHNYLNPIATAFTVKNDSGISDPIREPLDPDHGQVVTEPKVEEPTCTSSDLKICAKNGATCEVLPARRGSTTSLCRWSGARTEAACKRTAGIWTTPNSTYSRNHPGTVPAGAAGSCTTEVRNLRSRID